MTDHAIVVGINNYRAFSPQLEGPEKDALAFRKWLIDHAKVPSANIRTVLSSEFAASNVPEQPTAKMQPTIDAVNAKFMELVHLANKNFQRLPRIGRRLYIYLSGHGITPRTTNQLESAALLMANAEPESAGFHLPGPAYAEWFRKSHAFDEIVLFMDCCRNAYDDVDQATVPFSPLKGGKPDQVKTFYALATQWDAPAYEQPLGSPAETRGVFTYALLDVLRSGAGDSTGKLTAKGLAGNLKIAIAKLRDGDVPQFPKFSFSDIDDLVLVDSGSAAFPKTTIRWSAGFHGATVEIRDGFYEPLSPAVNLTASAADTVLVIKPGLYNVRLAANQFLVLEIRPGLSKDVQDVGLVTVE